MKNKTRVLLYVRVSTQEQVNGYSIGEQSERLQQYAAAMDWTVIRTYIDPGFSGSSIDRPALQELIRTVRSGNVDKVVVYKLDRLSRSQKDTLYLIEDVFLASGTDFVSMSENFDTSTPFGRAMIGLLAVFAQLEREQIKERMQLGRVARAKAGLYNASGRAALGYDYIDGQLVINEYQAVYVKKVFELFAAGRAIRPLCDLLLEAGVTSTLWPNRALKTLLSNRHYIGEVSFAGQWYPGKHEPIIDKDLFDKVQLRLAQYDEVPRGSREHLLTGLVYCGRCGARYFYMSKKDGPDRIRTYYTCYSRQKVAKNLVIDSNCKNKIWRAEDLEQLVLGEIRKLAVDREYLDRLAEADPDPDDRELAALQSELDSVTSQISRYMDLYALGSIRIDDVDRAITPLTARRSAIEKRIRQVRETDDRLSKADAAERLKEFGDIIEDGSYDDLRLIITTLIRKIVIEDKDVIIYWRFN